MFSGLFFCILKIFSIFVSSRSPRIANTAESVISVSVVLIITAECVLLDFQMMTLLLFFSSGNKVVIHELHYVVAE